jgi:hypothetical protein
MSSKPKFSSTDFNTAERAETTFFIWDTKDGRVAVDPVKPAADVAWPVQVVRVVGTSQVAPPNSPLTAQEFAAWREGLEEGGFNFDIRFK